MRELTRAEEEIMQVLWKLEKAFVKKIIEELPEPKPAYNTVSTIVRILEQKGFVGHEAFGKSHRYHPLVSKESYTKSFMSGFVSKYFSGSYQQMVSFFTKEQNLSLAELEQLLDELKSSQP
ncbi:MAG: BlaI/MecI/CopY family transcriptional regulator [Cyclobacteriaceae bacterium]|nr:BlaI/MecI/CopY family transcriptional regulator [Cyclobacteriaceae bacterium HetDA_MAG_MS6]